MKAGLTHSQECKELHVKQLFLSLVMLLTFSCQAQEKGKSGNEKNSLVVTDKTISAHEVQLIKNKFQSTRLNGTGSGDHDQYWTPEVFLPLLNPWFEVGRGLRPSKLISGKYLVYEMKKMPADLLSELEKSLLNYDYSLALISISFWKQIAEAQKQGLKIAFVSSASPSSANGVYFHYLNLIAIKVTTDPGTFKHEKRHADQYKKIERSYYPRSLSQSCMNSMSTAFGEIDATTTELGLHALKADQQDELFISPENHKQNTYPEINILSVNLEYPGSVSLSPRNNEDCPEQVRSQMASLSNYFYEQRSSIDESFRVITSAIAEKGKILNWREKNCGTQTSDNCEKFKSRLLELEKEYFENKKIFKNKIYEEVNLRPLRIIKTLESFDSETIQDLCRGSLGVGFYINCEEL